MKLFMNVCIKFLKVNSKSYTKTFGTGHPADIEVLYIENNIDNDIIRHERADGPYLSF